MCTYILLTYALKKGMKDGHQNVISILVIIYISQFSVYILFCL